MTRMERNNLIVKHYQDGVTQDDLAVQFKLSPARVWQVLRAAGVTRENRPTTKSPRNKFVGAHLSLAVRQAVKRVAESEGKSVSQHIADLVMADLKRRGEAIMEPVSTEVEPSLPYGG